MFISDKSPKSLLDDGIDIRLCNDYQERHSMMRTWKESKRSNELKLLSDEDCGVYTHYGTGLMLVEKH